MPLWTDWFQFVVTRLSASSALRHAGGFAFAFGHRAGAAGNAHPLNGHRDDNGHEQQRRQHLGQREACGGPVAPPYLSVSRIS